MVNNSTDAGDMVDRADRVINALTNSFLSAAEAAAERLEMSTQVAQLRARMATFSSVLESIAARKEAVYTRIEACKLESLKRLYLHEIEMLQDQEAAILKAAGMTGDLKTICQKADEKLYRRDGSRFIPAVGSTTNGEGSGTV